MRFWQTVGIIQVDFRQFALTHSGCTDSAPLQLTSSWDMAIKQSLQPHSCRKGTVLLLEARTDWSTTCLRGQSPSIGHRTSTRRRECYCLAPSDHRYRATKVRSRLPPRQCQTHPPSIDAASVPDCAPATGIVNALNAALQATSELFKSLTCA